MKTVTTLHGRTALIEEIINDPRTRFWLRDALIELCDRDPLDACRDAETLWLAMRDRLERLT